MTFFILLPILLIVLFILYKVVTSTSLPSINTKINTTRKNSPTIKNSFNETINLNIDKSTHTNYETKVSSSNDTDSSAILYIALGAVISVIILNIYKKYFSEINTILICAPFAILILYLLIAIIFKLKNSLSIELVRYLIISFLAVSVVITFYFFPIFKPKDIDSLLSSKITLDFIDKPSFIFIIFGLLGSFVQLLYIIIALIQVIKNYTYEQIIFNSKFMACATIFTFFLTSGIAFHLFELLQSYSSIKI